MAAVEFLPNGVAEVMGHPKEQDPNHYAPTFEAATSMVWRALGLLCHPHTAGRTSTLATPSTILCEGWRARMDLSCRRHPAAHHRIRAG